MALIETFIREIDRLWRPRTDGKIELRIIGSGALMLQTKYERHTKDGDVLETQALVEDVREALLTLAGKESGLHARHRIYLDIVRLSLPFLPQKPLFHPVKALGNLRHFEIKVLDIADVVVSKLKRFNANDRADAKEMILQGLLPHAKLIERFKLAVDAFDMDARAEDLPEYIENLHSVERTYFNVPTTHIDLPDWME